ncbi:hypothetical protein C2E23DRAFT_435711 [Lenzites betulinus]|nr:hypothetical protein C2E23DRAFT_435711 [Lenzites betulinus]
MWSACLRALPLPTHHVLAMASRPRTFLPYKIRLLPRRILRPRDLLARPRDPREPSLPAELFTAALLENDFLGLKHLKNQEPIHNVVVRLVSQEICGIFQVLSTYKLHLVLEPRMFMTSVRVFLADFVGDECRYSAPTWLQSLRLARGQTLEFIRSYEWLEKIVYPLVTTPAPTPCPPSVLGGMSSRS